MSKKSKITLLRSEKSIEELKAPIEKTIVVLIYNLLAEIFI